LSDLQGDLQERSHIASFCKCDFCVLLCSTWHDFNWY